MLELRLIKPVSYTNHSFKAFKTAYNITVTKAYNDIGSFNFSVVMSLSEFDTLITTSEGQAQVMLYQDGRPFMHGIITSYSPKDNNTIDVECTEILQLLRDDIAIGNFKLSNWIADYVPSNSPDATSDLQAKKAYWGEKGKSFFVADFYNNTNSGSSVINTIAVETDSGVTTSNQSTFYLCRFHPRGLIGNYMSEMKATLKGVGIPQHYFFLGSQNFNDKTASQVNPNSLENHIRLGFRFTNFVNSQYFEYVAEIIYDYGGGSTVVASLPIVAVTADSGVVYPEDLLLGADSTVNYHYKENASSIEVSAQIVFEYLGETFNYSISANSIPKPSSFAGYNSQGYFALFMNTEVYQYKVERQFKETYADWLSTASPNINFIAGDNSGILDGYTWNIKATDTERWTLVKLILSFMSSATLNYAGVVAGKPTYSVSDYEALPTLVKFANGDEVFNVSYDRDFSDIFNVLTANASRERQLAGSTVKEVYSVTIAPNPERPNRLGRLVKRVMNPSGIEDLATLTQWAFAVYDEHSYPEEAISFDTINSSFWSEVKLGQYITLHGVVEGKGLNEQINKLVYSDATGLVSVELAKRITLRSALIESRLNSR